MKIIIGSKNPVKKAALVRALSAHPDFPETEVLEVDVESGVGAQPLDLKTVLAGAANRAKNAFATSQDCQLSVGIESGLFRLEQPSQVPNKGPEFWLDVSVCALHDGQETYFGFSPAFPIPPEVMRFVLEDGLDLSRAAKAAGLTSEEYVGYGKGIIAVLTKGVVTREDYTVQAVLMALTGLKRR